VVSAPSVLLIFRIITYLRPERSNSVGKKLEYLRVLLWSILELRTLTQCLKELKFQLLMRNMCKYKAITDLTKMKNYASVFSKQHHSTRCHMQYDQTRHKTCDYCGRSGLGECKMPEPCARLAESEVL